MVTCTIFTDQTEVAEEMNNFYLNIAKDIGADPTTAINMNSSTIPEFISNHIEFYSEHSSIKNIKNNGLLFLAH